MNKSFLAHSLPLINGEKEQPQIHACMPEVFVVTPIVICLFTSTIEWFQMVWMTAQRNSKPTMLIYVFCGDVLTSLHEGHNLPILDLLIGLPVAFVWLMYIRRRSCWIFVTNNQT